MGSSPKYKLNKQDLPAIGKAWLCGAGLAVLVFTGDFVLTEIDLGIWGPAAVAIVPTVLKAAQRWWTDFNTPDPKPAE